MSDLSFWTCNSEAECVGSLNDFSAAGCSRLRDAATPLPNGASSHPARAHSVGSVTRVGTGWSAPHRTVVAMHETSFFLVVVVVYGVAGHSVGMLRGVSCRCVERRSESGPSRLSQPKS